MNPTFLARNILRQIRFKIKTNQSAHAQKHVFYRIRRSFRLMEIRLKGNEKKGCYMRVRYI